RRVLFRSSRVTVYSHFAFGASRASSTLPWRSRTSHVSIQRKRGLYGTCRARAEYLLPAADDERPDLGHLPRRDHAPALVEREVVDLAPELEIGGFQGFRALLRHQARGREPFELADVVRVLDELRMLAGMAQHEVVDEELDIREPARILLQVEAVGTALGELRAHPRPHSRDLVLQAGTIDVMGQDLAPLGLERVADR